MTRFAAIRCPHCGTYTLLGGDPCDCRTKLPPVIIGEGDLDDQVRYAIRCVCGEDRVILEVEHAQVCLPDPFPSGTRLFYVTSLCGHPSCAPHVDKVYWCKDRSVVVQFSQLSPTLLGNVVRQLRGECQ